MRLYAGSSGQFVEDTVLNQVAGKLKNAFFAHYSYNPPHAEINSWQNSLRTMAGILQYGDLLDHGVMLEYQLPLTSRHLGFMVTGKGQVTPIRMDWEVIKNFMNTKEIIGR